MPRLCQAIVRHYFIASCAVLCDQLGPEKRGVQRQAALIGSCLAALPRQPVSFHTAAYAHLAKRAQSLVRKSPSVECCLHCFAAIAASPFRRATSR